MQKDIRHLLQRNALAIAISITFLIAYLSLGRSIDFDLEIPISTLDKVKHAMAYFVLCYSWMTVLENKRKLSKNKRILLVLLFLYGALMEILQMTITTYRQGDYFDLLANLSGILACYLLFNKIHQKISVNL
jgi:VanZ family protein